MKNKKLFTPSPISARMDSKGNWIVKNSSQIPMKNCAILGYDKLQSCKEGSSPHCVTSTNQPFFCQSGVLYPIPKSSYLCYSDEKQAQKDYTIEITSNGEYNCVASPSPSPPSTSFYNFCSTDKDCGDKSHSKCITDWRGSYCYSGTKDNNRYICPKLGKNRSAGPLCKGTTCDTYDVIGNCINNLPCKVTSSDNPKCNNIISCQYVPEHGQTFCISTNINSSWIENSAADIPDIPLAFGITQQECKNMCINSVDDNGNAFQTCQWVPINPNSPYGNCTYIPVESQTKGKIATTAKSRGIDCNHYDKSPCGVFSFNLTSPSPSPSPEMLLNPTIKNG